MSSGIHAWSFLHQECVSILGLGRCWAQALLGVFLLGCRCTRAAVLAGGCLFLWHSSTLLSFVSLCSFLVAFFCSGWRDEQSTVSNRLPQTDFRLSTDAFGTGDNAPDCGARFHLLNTYLLQTHTCTHTVRSSFLCSALHCKLKGVMLAASSLAIVNCLCLIYSIEASVLSWLLLGIGIVPCNELSIPYQQLCLLHP
jgi:hypothetical protein